MDDFNTIGERIKSLREKNGLTQLELSKKLSVKRETVVQWETGVRDLKTDYTIRLSDFFGVTCDEILRGIKAENLNINKEVGLSDKAIKQLKDYVNSTLLFVGENPPELIPDYSEEEIIRNKRRINKNYLQFINYFIESFYSIRLSEFVSDFKQEKAGKNITLENKESLDFLTFKASLTIKDMIDDYSKGKDATYGYIASKEDCFNEDDFKEEVIYDYVSFEDDELDEDMIE